MIKSRIEELTDEQYKSKLKCHAKAYRKKIVVYPEKIRLHFYNESIPKDKKILGCYRHFNYYTNQDYIVEQIKLKWEHVNKAFCSDLIHSLQNKVNDKILECILMGPVKPHEK